VREYETTLIVQPEISEEGSEAVLQKLDGILESKGATRLICEDLGKRKLAYEIRKFHKGHYYILYFLDAGEAVPELERVLGMDESVLRFMTVQVDDDVTDIEARCAAAREAEVAQVKRAEERATREAEDRAAREAQEAEARAEAAAAAEAAASVAEEAASAAGASDSDESVESAEAEPPRRRLLTQ